MSAKTALELGAPIRDILVFTLTSTDNAGRSIPAPGHGAPTVAREVPSKYPLPILDIAYRSRQLTFRRSQISQWLIHEHSELQGETDFRKSQGEAVDDKYFSSRVGVIENEAKRQEQDAIAMYGILEGADTCISPLRRAPAVWGLTGDDIGVLSIHGTSTPTGRTRDKCGTTSSHRSPVSLAMPVMAQKQTPRQL